MSGSDRKIDPLTGDYVDNGLGSWDTTRTASTAVYHALLGKYGCWVGDPDAGSQLHNLRRASADLADLRARVTDYATTALLPLVAAGRISAPVVAAEMEGVGVLAWQGVCVDKQSGEEIDFSELLPREV